jgi:hypothetical protein
MEQVLAASDRHLSGYYQSISLQWNSAEILKEESGALLLRHFRSVCVDSDFEKITQFVQSDSKLLRT